MSWCTCCHGNTEPTSTIKEISSPCPGSGHVDILPNVENYDNANADNGYDPIVIHHHGLPDVPIHNNNDHHRHHHPQPHHHHHHQQHQQQQQPGDHDTTTTTTTSSVASTTYPRTIVHRRTTTNNNNNNHGLSHSCTSESIYDSPNVSETSKTETPFLPAFIQRPCDVDHIVIQGHDKHRFIVTRSEDDTIVLTTNTNETDAPTTSFSSSALGLDVTFVTDRIITVTHSVNVNDDDDDDDTWDKSFHTIVQALYQRYKGHYKVFKISEQAKSLSSVCEHFVSFPWKEDCAPPLESLCLCCEMMHSWLSEVENNVVVLLSTRIFACFMSCLSAYMHFIDSASAFQSKHWLECFALRRFCEFHLTASLTPSQLRYVIYFTDFLNGVLDLSVVEDRCLHSILLHFNLSTSGQFHGTMPFFSFEVKELCGSSLYKSPILQPVFPIDRSVLYLLLHPVPILRGNILLNFYLNHIANEDNNSHWINDSLFQLQFHTCAIKDSSVSFYWEDLDLPESSNTRCFDNLELRFKHDSLVSLGYQSQVDSGCIVVHETEDDDIIDDEGQQGTKQSGSSGGGGGQYILTRVIADDGNICYAIENSQSESSNGGQISWAKSRLKSHNEHPDLVGDNVLDHDNVGENSMRGLIKGQGTTDPIHHVYGPKDGNLYATIKRRQIATNVELWDEADSSISARKDHREYSGSEELNQEAEELEKLLRELTEHTIFTTAKYPSSPQQPFPTSPQTPRQMGSNDTMPRSPRGGGGGGQMHNLRHHSESSSHQMYHPHHPHHPPHQHHQYPQTTTYSSSYPTSSHQYDEHQSPDFPSYFPAGGIGFTRHNDKDGLAKGGGGEAREAREARAGVMDIMTTSDVTPFSSSQGQHSQQGHHQHHQHYQHNKTITLDEIQNVKKMWFKPTVKREEVVTELWDKPCGSFIVRESHSVADTFVLTIKVDNTNWFRSSKESSLSRPDVALVHFAIDQTHLGVRIRGCRPGETEQWYRTLTHLIYAHTTNPGVLPCCLLLHSTQHSDVLFSRPDYNVNITAPTANAWKVTFLGSFECEQLTGSNAISRSVDRLFSFPLKNIKFTECFLRADIEEGILITDNFRKLFFRRHYPLQLVSCCDLDLLSRSWYLSPDPLGGKIFGFVARKLQGTDSCCHIFSDCGGIDQASLIVAAINNILHEWREQLQQKQSPHVPMCE